MASFTNFTIEGDATLDYFGDLPGGLDRRVRIMDDAEGASEEGSSLENVIAKSLGFPNEGEFDEFFRRMEALRERELQPADGVPDISRESVRLRITVEVIEDDAS